MSTGVFPDQFKNCSVHPLLKKSNLDKENLSNYRPISHLSYLSKLTERLVKNRLADHLNENNLMNSFQSAYTKFNSTETTLLAVHDHVIRAMSQQQVTGLCLLDLSAAFDTIDHTILLHRLKSWFGSLTLSYPGFSLTFHLVLLLLISMASNLLPLNFSTVFLKVLFLVLYSSYSIQLHSVQ